MKIAITGHTKGLGLSCFQLLAKNYEIIGLSSSNGYDINNTDHILNAIKTADVFINNAYSGYAQANLLEKVYTEWQYQNKIIINISSTVTEFSRTEENLNHLPWPYRDHKAALEKIFKQYARNNNNCRIQLLRPGPMDTDMIKHLTCKKLDTNIVAYHIKQMIETKEILEMTLYAK